MPLSATVTNEPAVAASFEFLGEMLSEYGPRDFAVRAWDGIVWEPDAGQPARFTLVLQHLGAVRKMFWPPRPYTLGEAAYIYDDIDNEGDIHASFAVISYRRTRKPALRTFFRLADRESRVK
jgi:cyclopropane-fatty-acyl-phospholipid synthase